MSDIFKDMQTKVGCDYISDLPSYNVLNMLTPQR